MEDFKKQVGQKTIRFFSVKTIVILAFLLTIEIVLSRFFSIQALTMKFSFSFIPIIIAAILYGPAGSALLAGLADVIGANLFPAGPFFIGFTITAILKGAWYGAILKKKQSLVAVIIMVVVSQVVGSLLLNSLWISMLYGKAFWALIPGRVLQSIALGALEIVLIPIINKVLMPQLKALAAE